MRTINKRSFLLTCLLSLVLVFSAFGFVSVNKAFASVDFKVEQGAYIRVTEPDGIRFRASVSEIPEDATFGALILPQYEMGEQALELGNYAKAMHFKNMEGFLGEDGRYYFNAVITGIPASEFDTELVANFYMTIDGQTVYTGNIVRSIKQVSEMIIASESQSITTKDAVVKYTYSYNANYLVGTIAGKNLSTPNYQTYRFVENKLNNVYLTAGDIVSVLNPETLSTTFIYDTNNITSLQVVNEKISVLESGLYDFTIDGDTVKVTAFNLSTGAPVVTLASNNNVFLVGKGENKYFAFNTFGKDFVIKNGDYELVSDVDYRVNGEIVVIADSYLKTLEKGKSTLTVVTESGETNFVVNGVVAPFSNNDNQNVTKFTNEVISNEKLRVSADNGCSLVDFTMVGVKVYNYDSEEYVDGDVENANTVSGSFGKVVINDDKKSFDFERANGWFGKIEFTYIATDNNGYQSAPITMDVVYKELAPTIGEKDDKVYHKASGNENDIIFTITNANVDDTVIAITNGDYKLVEDVDYTVGARSDNYKYFTIKASYLNTLSYGDAILTLYTSKGNETMNIKIVDKLVASENSVIVDKAKVQDKVVTLIGGYPFEVKESSIGSEYYEFNAETGELTVKASYFETLTYGDVEISFNNGFGRMWLYITVEDSRTPVLLSQELNFVSGSNVGVNVQFTMYDKTFVALYNGENEVGAVNYSFENDILTVKGEYINQVASGLSELTLSAKMSDDSIVNFTIIIESSSSNPTVTNLSAYEIDVANDVTGEVNLDGGVLQGISYNGNTVDAEFWSMENDILTIKSNYLTEIYRFGTTLYAFELSTDKGNASFEVEYLNAENKILNAGFETGNLYGWNRISNYDYSKFTDNWTFGNSWVDARVVEKNYFEWDNGGYTYNKDGKYNLGIYGDDQQGISKDDAQRYIGVIRSSDFVLGGSGWISFKLGGGKIVDFAYVSVRETLTNKEVARFGNLNFNNKDLSGTSNAEAYMFKYYFDLSQVGKIGTSYYITLTDSVSDNWCVLSADSFYTYYATAPNTEDGFIATNIVPNILGTENAKNEIVNGYFDNGLDGWSQGYYNIGKVSDENGKKVIDTNENGGDGAMGVVRSSAFTVGDLTHIYYRWAGCYKDYKNLFISIKEVGTNIEVLRFAKRNENNSEGNYHTHIMNLSSLQNDGKQYYMELCDNHTGGWGLFRADEFHFVSATDGDNNYMVGGIQTNYTYVLPYNV